MTKKTKSSELLRENMRLWASGVGVVCSALGENRHGMTISSFTSLSLVPPRILISVDKRTRSHQLITESRSFCVTLLNAEQEGISRSFAGEVSEAEDRFKGIDWMESRKGNPIISGGLAYFDCEIRESIDSGSHTIFIGEVVDAGKPDGQLENQQPLIYFNQDYRSINN